MKVVVTNQVALNTGDAAILHGTLAVLKAAFGDGLEVEVVDRHAGIAQLHYPEIRFRQMHRLGLVRRATRRLLGSLDPFGLVSKAHHWLAWRSASSTLANWLLPKAARDNLRAYRSADLIVSAGGTYLVEHYHLEENLLQLALASASGRPLVLFTQSAGPFARAANRRALAKLLPRVTLALLRDERSRANMVEAGLPPWNSEVVADAAFALATPDATKGTRDRASRSDFQVAVSVRSWMFPGHPSPDLARDAYAQSIVAAVTRLVRTHGASVTFLSTCQGVPQYGYDDAAFARSVATRLPAEIAAHVRIDDVFHTPGQLQALLAGFDMIIATRMHMAILGLCAGTPVLPIAYEFKTKELFATLGLGEWSLDIDSLSPDRVCDHVESFIGQLDTIQPQLAQSVLQQHRSAFSVAPRLAQIVRAKATSPAGSRSQSPTPAAA